MVKNLLRQAFETIQFQNGSFARELEFMISNFREQPYNSLSAQKSKEVRAIEKFILNKTGLNINLVVSENVDAMILAPIPTINHIFFHDSSNSIFLKDTAIKASKDFHNSLNDREIMKIDLKNSKITGVVDKIKITIFIGWDLILTQKYLNDSEITAILLHELGHAFTIFEYINRLYSTNLAIQTIASSMVNGDKDSYLIELRKESKKLFNNETALDALKEITDTKVMAIFVLSTEIKRVNSELGTPFYDSVSCEYMADQFVARHKYGYHLIKALEKTTNYTLKDYKDKGQTSSGGILLDILLIIILIAGPILTIGGMAAIFSGKVAGLIYLFAGVIMSYFSILLGNITSNRPAYDELKIRYSRLREQLIQNLKVISNENKDILLENIKAIDEAKLIIEKADFIIPINRKILAFLSPTQRKAQDALNLQRELEELASNELYVQSAKLNTIKI